MTKAEIIDAVYEKVGGFSKKEAAEVVEAVFDTMKDVLAEGEKIKISGFGNFVVRAKKERIGRNPQTFTNIPTAEADDFQVAQQRVYFTRDFPSRITSTSTRPFSIWPLVTSVVLPYDSIRRNSSGRPERSAVSTRRMSTSMPPPGRKNTVRSSAWNPKGINVRLYAPLRAMPAAKRSECASRLAAMNAP